MGSSYRKRYGRSVRHLALHHHRVATASGHYGADGRSGSCCQRTPVANHLPQSFGGSRCVWHQQRSSPCGGSRHAGHGWQSVGRLPLPGGLCGGTVFGFGGRLGGDGAHLGPFGCSAQQHHAAHHRFDDRLSGQQRHHAAQLLCHERGREVLHRLGNGQFRQRLARQHPCGSRGDRSFPLSGIGACQASQCLSLGRVVCREPGLRHPQAPSSAAPCHRRSHRHGHRLPGQYQ